MTYVTYIYVRSDSDLRTGLTAMHTHMESVSMSVHAACFLMCTCLEGTHVGTTCICVCV